MSQAVIGNLRVNLGLDSAEFQNGAKKAQGTLAGLSKAVKGFAAGFAGGLTLTGVGMAIQATINRMDDLGKAAQKIGIPVEELSKLEYAARLADVPLEALTSTMARFSRNIVEVQGGATNAAGGALQALGISATDAQGKLRPTIDIMSDVAEEFAAMQDGAGKTAIAIALFGKSGADMIPLLNGGRAAIAGAGEELARFGGVVTPEAARQAEQFNDSLTRLTMAARSLLQQAILPLAPEVNRLTEALIGIVRDGQAVPAFFDNLRVFIANTNGEVEKMMVLLSAASDIWDNPQGPTAAIERWKQAGAEITAINQRLKQQVGEITGSNDPGGLMAGVNRRLDMMSGKGDLPGDINLRSSQKLGTAPFLPPDTEQKVAGVRDRLTEAAAAADDLKAAGQSVWEQTRTPLETYQLEIRKLNELLEDGAINHETYKLAVAQLQDEFGSAASAASEVNEWGETLSSTFSSWANSAIDGTFELTEALADLAKQLSSTFINTAIGNLFGGGGSSVSPSQQGGGGILGGLLGLFGGFFAEGGTLRPGQWGIAGENGPEPIFAGSVPLNVYPNSAPAMAAPPAAAPPAADFGALATAGDALTAVARNIETGFEGFARLDDAALDLATALQEMPQRVDMSMAAFDSALAVWPTIEPRLAESGGDEPPLVARKEGNRTVTIQQTIMANGDREVARIAKRESAKGIRDAFRAQPQAEVERRLRAG